LCFSGLLLFINNDIAYCCHCCPAFPWSVLHLSHFESVASKLIMKFLSGGDPTAMRLDSLVCAAGALIGAARRDQINAHCHELCVACAVSVISPKLKHI
jgi:hypothetical protein